MTENGAGAVSETSGGHIQRTMLWGLPTTGCADAPGRCRRTMARIFKQTIQGQAHGLAWHTGRSPAEAIFLLRDGLAAEGIFLYHGGTKCKSAKRGFAAAFSGSYCRTCYVGEFTAAEPIRVADLGHDSGEDSTRNKAVGGKTWQKYNGWWGLISGPAHP